MSVFCQAFIVALDPMSRRILGTGKMWISQLGSDTARGESSFPVFSYSLYINPSFDHYPQTEIFSPIAA